MSAFKTLFGIESSQVKKNCILLPLLPRGASALFKVRKFSRGKLFGAGNSDNFTLINCGPGPAMAGDAVLYLKETACENAVLFGSCGLTGEKPGLSVGSLACPSQCYSRESFTDLLLSAEKPPAVFYPAGDLFRRLLNSGGERQIKEVTCATIASLKLEEQMAGSLIQQGIEAVDMECSAVFSAAGFIGIKAAALFYVSDIINKEPFYNLDSRAKLKLCLALKRCAGILREFSRYEK